MSCNHMYVTDVDKALNMCGLCGVTFDEWREGKVSTFKDGVTAERERIIKLLKDDLCGNGKPALSDDEHCEHDEQTLHLIALIKGDSNV